MPYIFVPCILNHPTGLVTNGKYEPLRDGETSVFSARLRLFEVFGLRDRDLDSKRAFQKVEACETFRTAQKTRLRDP